MTMGLKCFSFPLRAPGIFSFECFDSIKSTFDCATGPWGFLFDKIIFPDFCPLQLFYFHADFSVFVLMEVSGVPYVAVRLA